MSDKDIVDTARKRYRQAKEFWSASRFFQKKDILFSFGDTYNGNQYIGEEGTPEDFLKRGLLTINIVDPACKKIVNSVRMNRPQAKLNPGDTTGSVEAAEIVEKWSRALKSKSNADDATDCAVEMQVRGGEGYFEIAIDYASPESFEKEAIISPIRDPFSILLDPQSVKSTDGTSAKWGFKEEVVPKDEVKIRFGVDPANWETDREWVMDDAVIICRYVYCETEKATLYQYKDNTSGLDKDHKPLMLDQSGKPIKRTTYIDKWYDCILLGGEDKPFHKEEWHGEAVPFCPVWGQLYSENGTYYLKGEVRNQIDQNRVINYMASKGVNSIAREELGGYLVAVEAKPNVAPEEDTWKLEAQGIPQKVKFWNSLSEDGNALPMPHKEVQSSMSSDKFNAMQTFLEFAHNTSGQFSAPGEIAPGASGRAVNARQQQADLATFHYPDNLSRALRYCEEQLVRIFKKIHQPGQTIRLLGADGSEERAQVNPTMGKAYAEAENKDNPLGASHIINPDLLGKLDVVITIGPSYQTQRQEKADIVAEMVKNNPTFWQTHPKQIIESLDLPDKQAWIDQFKKVNPEMFGDEEENNEPLPPEVQQQMEEMQSQIQEMESALQGAQEHMKQLQEENQGLQMKAAQAEAKAITTQIQSKRLELSMLESKSVMQPQMAQGESQEEEEEEYMDPQLDEVLLRLEQQEQQIELLAQGQEAIAESLAKTKTSKITITSPSGKVYTGEKIEE